MPDIIHRVGIKAAPGHVYEALATIDGLSGWWTRATAGNPEPGGTIVFRFHTPAGEEIGRFDMEVLETVPGRTVRWRVTGGPAEWLDTRIGFRLSGAGEYTIVQFAHRGWREEVEFMAHCSTKWATFLLSLRDFVETGRGRPSPDDLNISDWH